MHIRRCFIVFIIISTSACSSLQTRLSKIEALNESDPVAANEKIAELKKTNPDDADIWVSAGRIALRQQRCERAKIAFQYALNMGSTREDNYLGLGICADKNNNHDLAKKYYTQGISSHPESWQLHNNLAYSYLLSADINTAIKNLTELNIRHTQPSIRHNLAIAYAMKGEFDKAFDIEQELYSEKIARNNQIIYRNMWQQKNTRPPKIKTESQLIR